MKKVEINTFPNLNVLIKQRRKHDLTLKHNHKQTLLQPKLERKQKFNHSFNQHKITALLTSTSGVWLFSSFASVLACMDSKHKPCPFPSITGSLQGRVLLKWAILSVCNETMRRWVVAAWLEDYIRSLQKHHHKKMPISYCVMIVQQFFFVIAWNKPVDWWVKVVGQTVLRKC